MEDSYKPKVLIVDDEKGLRIGTKRLLELEGYDVETAENGTEGIKKGTETDFDMAILDLKMPDKDGIEVLTEIRKAQPNTVCYIATAYASFDTAVEATKLGAFSYIPKPFSPDELLQQLERGYEKRKFIIETENLRKEREARLLEVAFEKTRLNTIISSIKDGVMVVNKSGETVLYNPSVLRYLNLEKLEIEKNIIDKLHPQIAELINKFLIPGIYSNKSYSAQVELSKSEELFVDVTSSAVPHPDGSLAGVVIVIKNISKLKKIEQVKSQFVSMVAHELKTPMAAVLGFIKLILDESVGITKEQERDFLNRLQLRLNNLLQMVNDLLDISRMELKTAQREIKNLNINEIINSVLELLQFEIEKRKLTINYVPVAGLPELPADHDEITRVITNFMSNAIKYNKESGSITITNTLVNNYLVIKISDTGIGLKPEEKNRLFSEFFRAKNEKTKNISGTGLGLSIVKRIIESYSGKIEVESEYGVGTTFTMYFPLKNEITNGVNQGK